MISGLHVIWVLVMGAKIGDKIGISMIFAKKKTLQNLFMSLIFCRLQTTNLTVCVRD